jgi:hypothetical protein
VQSISTQKPRWLRDLVRFLPLRSQFVLSGNVRDLHIHEPAPGEITAVPLATILVDQLKGSGYQRIVTFDPIAGFRSIAAPGASAEAGDEFLRGIQVAIASRTSLTLVFPRPSAQVSTEIQPGQRIEQP